MLNLLFNYFRNKNGFFHWLLQRFSACLILISIVFFYSHLSCFFVCFIILGFHLFVGIETLIDDYIHDHSLHLIGCTLLRIFVLFYFKMLFIFFL